MLTGVCELCLVCCVFTHVWGVFCLSSYRRPDWREYEAHLHFCLWLDSGPPDHMVVFRDHRLQASAGLPETTHPTTIRDTVIRLVMQTKKALHWYGVLSNTLYRYNFNIHPIILK